ncbi:MAG TPA: hypothetical protein VH880_00060 [Anaeromyxobacteraceae bacterium]
MRPRLPLVLAAASLAAAGAARADVVKASSTTLLGAGQVYREGTLKAAYPVLEMVSVSASEIRTGVGEFEAALSGWGALDAGAQAFWQNGAPHATRQSGDLDVGYVRGDLFGRTLGFRVGRQMVVEGVSRMVHLDGGHLALRIPFGTGRPRFVPSGATLSAYAGLPVAPRFATRGGERATGNVRADVAYGGRASLSWPGVLDLGASLAFADDGKEVSRRDVGADLRLSPHRAVQVTGSTFYSLAEGRLGEAEAAVDVQAARGVVVFADLRHVEPDLYLSRSSILAAFAAAKRDDAGGGVRWARRGATLEADAHLLRQEEGDGTRLRLKGTLRPWLATVVGADAQLLRVPDNGYWLARLFGSREWGRIATAIDVWVYGYRKPVNGVDQSVGGTASGGYRVAPGWRLVLAGTAGSDPFFKSRVELLARLVYEQTYVREVR